MRFKIVTRANKFARLQLLAAALIALAGAPAAAHSSSHGDIVSFGHGVTVPAGEEVKGDVVVFGGGATIHGKVDGDAVVMGGTLHIFPEGSVAGDTVAFGGGVINDSRVHAQTSPGPSATPPAPEETSPPVEQQPPSEQENVNGPSASTVWSSIVIPDLILTLIVFALFPARTRVTLEQLAEKPALSGLLGFLSPAILVIVITALAITVVGIPLIPVAIVAFVAAYFVGKAAIALFIGRRFMEIAKVQDPKPFSALLLGLIVLLIVTGPTPLWFAIIATVCIGCLAVGASLVSFFYVRPSMQAPPAVYAGPAPATSGPPAVQ